MADNETEDEFSVVEEMSSDNATLLLEAAQSLGLEPEVVRTSSDGFVVPKAVNDKAFPAKPKRAAKDKTEGTGE